MPSPTPPTDILRGARIAHLIESSGPGGAERVVVELARAQRAAGAHTTVYLPQGGEPWLAEQLADSGVTTAYVPHQSPISPACVRTLAMALHRAEINLLHSHEFSMAVNGACAARAVGVPHVITMHGGRYFAARWRRRTALRFASSVSQSTVAVSDALADDLSVSLRLPRGHFITIANGVRLTPPAAAASRETLGLPADAGIILAVGNLYPVKGHRCLVEALRLLPPDTHLLIAGRGGEEAGLTARAVELGLADRLHLLGHRKDIPELLAMADVFAQPSLDEGLPLALLEAMFAGKPIVATDVGDIAKAVGPDGAVLVPPGDAPALAIALRSVLARPILASALARHARARAGRTYGLAPMLRRYTELYAPLLANGRSGTEARREDATVGASGTSGTSSPWARDATQRSIHD